MHTYHSLDEKIVVQWPRASFQSPRVPCVYAYMCVCMYAYMCVCMYAYMCVCMYAYMCATICMLCVCVCIYICI